MSSKMPRTRENYPNQLINACGKIRPEIVDWITDNHWNYKMPRTTLVGKMITFAFDNQTAFKEYLQQNNQVQN